MADPIRLNINGSKITTRNTDVVINDPSAATALKEDSATLLVGLQRAYGVTVSLNEIEVDRNGGVVIRNAALARVIKEKFSDPGSPRADNVCGNNNVQCPHDPGRIDIDPGRIDRQLGN
jgi:hypothetical protein